MKKKILFITLVIFFIDQSIKFLASTFLTKVTIIPGFLSLIYAENTGVAFSMLSGSRIIIIALSILLLMFLLYYMNKEYISCGKEQLSSNLMYGVLFGGILGNLFDRIVRSVVIDYVGLNLFNYSFPIFNFADLMITLGVIIMLIKILKEKKQQ